ncbi:hypothetical protein ACHAW6_003282 [Cyclotella cf. meneghiniana]
MECANHGQSRQTFSAGHGHETIGDTGRGETGGRLEVGGRVSMSDGQRGQVLFGGRGFTVGSEWKRARDRCLVDAITFEERLMASLLF